MPQALVKTRRQDSFARLSQVLRLAVVPLAVLLVGCVTTKLEELRQAETDIAALEGVVILGRRHDIGPQTEETFTECVSDVLRAGVKPLRVVPEHTFVDRLFPWFEPRTAPLEIQAMAQLLRKRRVAEKIAESRVRYLVWIDGATQSMGGGGSLACAASPAGGGCFGFLSWENDSSYEASIWDLKHSQSAGLISAEASGSSYLPAFIIPIPLIARTQAAACNGLARQLKEFLLED
jgi:hypothetical protein